MPTSAFSVWLPRVMFESALITVSILLALGLDEWREDRQAEETIEIAISNFLREIRQNKARVDDAAPFNRGLRDVLSQRYRDGDISSTTDFIDIVESYNTAVLQSTAWETALATGSVTIMDYHLVSALSLTYGLQNRYQEATREGLADLMQPRNLTSEELEVAVYNAVRYLDNITTMETELSVVYSEAEAIVLDTWASMTDMTPEEVRVWALQR
jgi:hypothetical protein